MPKQKQNIACPACASEFVTRHFPTPDVSPTHSSYFLHCWACGTCWWANRTATAAAAAAPEPNANAADDIACMSCGSTNVTKTEDAAGGGTTYRCGSCPSVVRLGTWRRKVVTGRFRAHPDMLEIDGKRTRIADLFPIGERWMKLTVEWEADE